ncbi:MAG TPA: Ku protein [Bryobacteraceae bacterium]|jgi:DNA end-binding protein Ku|nr:Ku protein [Bryobacteraceae bacterium]
MASTVWRGFITFGLISIPVRLFRAARAERVSFRRLSRTEAPAISASRQKSEIGEDAPTSIDLPAVSKKIRSVSAEPLLAPVEQAVVRKGSDEIVPNTSVVKGFEYEKDRYVVVEAEELKSIAPKTSTEMQIDEFVNLSEVDPVYFETSYYVVPEEAGQKAYALLYRSLQVAGLVAVAQFAMHSREHVVILRPGGKGMLAHTMFFSSEVRGDDEYRADTSTVTQKELDLAQKLIHSLAAPFEPQKYRDTYREKVESLIAQRVAGKPPALLKQPSVAASVVDITDALQRSLASLKKPVRSEEQPRADAKPAAPRRKKVSGNSG